MKRKPEFAPIVAEQPLAERADRAGDRQRRDPASAREARDAGRRSEDPTGWWWHDGLDWYFYGAEDPPT